MMSLEPIRLGGAGLLLLGYAALCFAKLRRPAPTPLPAGADWLVVYASQTGSAEFLAQRTAATLRTSGLHAHALDIASVDAALLASATRVLFIVSTYGAPHDCHPGPGAAALCRAGPG
jgi:sulfite reductase (NADPH) flavoprotein alpha-component